MKHDILVNLTNPLLCTLLLVSWFSILSRNIYRIILTHMTPTPIWGYKDKTLAWNRLIKDTFHLVELFSHSILDFQIIIESNKRGRGEGALPVQRFSLISGKISQTLPLCLRFWMKLPCPLKFLVALLANQYPLGTGHKLNVHKMFKKRPARLLNVLCTFNLGPVSRGTLHKIIHSWWVLHEERNCPRTKKRLSKTKDFFY